MRACSPLRPSLASYSSSPASSDPYAHTLLTLYWRDLFVVLCVTGYVCALATFAVNHVHVCMCVSVLCVSVLSAS